MKYFLIIVYIMLLFISCAKKTENETSAQNIPSAKFFNGNISTQRPAEKNQKEDTIIIQQETEEEIQNQLKNMTVQEIIDLYIQKKNGGFYIENGDYKLFYIFLSHNNIKEDFGYGGYKFYSYLYIIDDNNIRIESFYYSFGNYGIIGENSFVGKYYINITKENLIANYIGSNKFVEDFTTIESFKTNRFLNEDLLFIIQSDTIVYINGSLRNEKIIEIKKDTKVEIIDMFYNNMNDKHPVAVRIKTENFSGWVNVNDVDFLKKEVKGNVNGIWLHNEIRNVIKNYGPHAVKGKIINNSIPLRNAPSNNSEQLLLMREVELDFDEVFIKEVSVNLDTINDIEAAWYKIEYLKYIFEDNYDNVTGWIFGSNIEINPLITY